MIRVQADEVTYNLHILIRFELEQALIGGDLDVAELPGAWNEKYRAYLGIEPPDHASGCLQDIHWAAGLVGYFPTYTLGNLYAAQLYDQADAELGGHRAGAGPKGTSPASSAGSGPGSTAQGQRLRAADLIQEATGKTLDHRPLVASLRRKYEPLYHL